LQGKKGASNKKKNLRHPDQKKTSDKQETIERNADYLVKLSKRGEKGAFFRVPDENKEKVKKKKEGKLVRKPPSLRLLEKKKLRRRRENKPIFCGGKKNTH